MALQQWETNHMLTLDSMITLLNSNENSNYYDSASYNF